MGFFKKTNGAQKSQMPATKINHLFDPERKTALVAYSKKSKLRYWAINVRIWLLW